MPANDLQSLLRPADRFLRSAELVRDYRDLSALQGYCITDFTRECLARIGEGLLRNSSRRSWRLTGDYGSGKSSFGLLLAGSLRGATARLPKVISDQVLQVLPALRNTHYLPVLVVGNRESMGLAIIRSLGIALAELSNVGRKSALENEITTLVHQGRPLKDDKVIELVEKAASHVVSSGKAKGLVFILDEVGKFLEYAAQNPDQQDVFLLQSLAETASRSAETPILVICLLHQGFNAYADQLTLTSQKEWEKVAGRLEEIRFQQTLDQIVFIVGTALNVKLDKFESKFKRQSSACMEKAAELGWFGASASKKSLRDHALSIFPIDPLALPIMVRTFQRFGQNERSLFSFLFSFEPFGLRAFCSNQDVSSARPYRLHNFYDYVRTNFGHRLAVASYRSRWSVIEAMIESFNSPEPLDLIVLKTIGILNLLNVDDLRPTGEAISWGVAGDDKSGHAQVAASLKNLRKRGVIYFRGETLGYCLWPHTSVDIEARYDEAKRSLPALPNVAETIQNKLDTRPIVARRHYIESGNLRYFKVIYCPSASLKESIQTPVDDADGIILVPLCENEREHKEALKVAIETKGIKDRIQLVAVPKPLDKLSGCVLESLRWEWVISNTPELNHDKYAREEVSRYLVQTQNTVQNRIQEYIGLNRVAGHTSLTWFYRGNELPIRQGRQLLTKLSDLCDKVYSQAPFVKNELLNRNSLSSAAAAARMRLLELMFSAADKPNLGLPVDRKPPEKSMYLSVLEAAKLHRDDSGWKITNPTDDDPCRVAPALRKIRQLIHEKPDTRVSIDSIYVELRKPPYGLRDGLIPVLLAVVAIADEQEVALYENGTFLREVGDTAFLRMTKNPKNFDIQYCKIEGVRSQLFSKLISILEFKDKDPEKVELLDVVRNLCQFVAQLPDYVRNTKKLSKDALSVRDVILDAHEPVKMVFHDLPAACGFAKFEIGQPILANETQRFIGALKKALDELRLAFPALQVRLQNAILQSFEDESSGSFIEARRRLSERSEALLLHVTEMKLKAFCLRLFDSELPEKEWLESMGSFLALKPPTKWKDEEEELFNQEILACAGLFKRTESIAFISKGDRKSSGLRIAVTQADGQEQQQVLHFTAADEKKLAQLQNEIAEIMKRDKRLGMAAASRALWHQLKKTETIS